MQMYMKKLDFPSASKKNRRSQDFAWPPLGVASSLCCNLSQRSQETTLSTVVSAWRSVLATLQFITA